MDAANPTALLVARLLGGSRQRRFDLAHALVAECGGLPRLRRLCTVELEALGLGRPEALRLRAAFELGRRALFVRRRGPLVSLPRDAYSCVAAELLGLERERFIAVVLDVRNRPLYVAAVSEGGVDACPVDPREVFVHAVRERGSGVLVAHNHPSGDPSPSLEDLALTERLCRAGELLGIRLLDHLIVAGPDRWVSLAELGHLGQRTEPE